MQNKSQVASASLLAAAMLTSVNAQPVQEATINPTPVLVQSSDSKGVRVPQKGPAADKIKAHLGALKLPPGFKIDLYAVVPDAYRLAPSPADYGVFVGTRKSTVWIVTDPEGEAKPEEVKAFAPSLKFDRPEGICLTSDGYLVVVERNRIRTFSTMELFDGGDRSTRVRMVEVVPQGKLVELGDATASGERACRVGNDKKLYVGLGMSGAPASRRSESGGGQSAGVIVRMQPFLGTEREIFAHGLQAIGGLEFNSKDNALWLTENEIGDGAGKFTSGSIRRVQPSSESTPQEIVTPGRGDNVGMAFYNMTRFPIRYRGGIFSVQRGTPAAGAQGEPRVLFTPIKPDGTTDKTEVFAEGWRDAKTRRDTGRPVDVAQLFDGSVLISDDLAGAIYRVTYDGP